MMRGVLAILLASFALIGCGAERVQDAPAPPEPASRLTAAESAAIDARVGLPAAGPPVASAAQAVEPPAETPPSATDDWDALEAELAGLPPIRTGPMASVSAPPGRDPLGDELASERRMQLDLPRADHPLWTTLRQTRISIDERTQLYRAVHSGPVRALAGQRVTVRGYMLPLEASDRTAHFLISPYTPVCFFHPPAEPNEVIEVRLSRPIEAGYHLVEVSGVLRLADDGEKGLFFVIDGGGGRILERVG